MRRLLRNGHGRNDYGGVAAEAAIIAPVLILLGLGAIDASLLYQQTHRMEAGLQAGGSYLTAGSANSVDQLRARQVAVSGELDNGAPRIPGWSAEDVTIAIRSIDNSAGRYRASGDVRIVRLSSSTPFRGFGLIRGVTGGRVQVQGAFETRLNS